MTISTDCFNIPGHTLIGNARVSGSGTHIFSRNPALCKFISSHSSCHNNGGRIEILMIKLYDPVIMDKPVVVSTYRSPHSSMKELYSDLEQVMSKSDHSDHLIVTGDCNVDLFARSPERDTFMKYFSNREFKQILSGVSTNYGSQLDCVFAKDFICLCDMYESYFSDHKPMLISLRTLVDSCSTMDCQLMVSHATDCTSVSQHNIIHIEQIPTDNTTKVDQDTFVHQVYIPTRATPCDYR